MPIKLPSEVVELLRNRVFEKADAASYLTSSRTQNYAFIEGLFNDPNIGGLIAQYYPKSRIRTYIKDALLNHYSKIRREQCKPSPRKMKDFCAQSFNVTDLCDVESNDDGIVLFKSESSPVFVVVSEGTYLKWGTALSKGLLYVASKPFGRNDNNIIHIVVSLCLAGNQLTDPDKDLLKGALSRADAIPFLWGDSVQPIGPLFDGQ